MDGDANLTAMNPPGPAAPEVVVPEQALPMLASLANARAITERLLVRMDSVAEAMAPDALARALAQGSTLTLNVARADRALRQIVAMELEVMGLREPPGTHGPSSKWAGFRRGSTGRRRRRPSRLQRSQRFE